MCDFTIDNNMHEVHPSPRNKRKISAPCPTAYMNPGLDLLATEDKICNTAMEVAPPASKKRKRVKSCTEVFDNSALDLGVRKEAVSAFLSAELRNVHQNLLPIPESELEQPEYVNIDEVKSERDFCIGKEVVATSNISMAQTNFKPTPTTKIVVNNNTSLNLSFIERLGLDSPNLSDRSLYLDDDLNESNIMEIKTITIVTKKKRINTSSQNCLVNTNPFLNCDLDAIRQNVNIMSRSNFPFDLPMQGEEDQSDEIIYNDVSMSDEEHMPSNSTQIQPIEFIPRRLFNGDATNSTISTVNEISMIHQETNENLYENIDNYSKDEPVYSVIDNPVFLFSANDNLNKQSKILGHDVTQFKSKDIMNNIKPPSESSYCSTNSNDTINSSDGKRNSTILKLPKISSKLSRRVFNKIKKTFKHEKPEVNTTLNPYEVPRKPRKIKINVAREGFENPALKLDCSDIIDQSDEEHEYECIETSRNTKMNERVTPLRERNTDCFSNSGNINTSNTPGRKQVRFDSTLNQEKLITGNSFDSAFSSEVITDSHTDIDNEIEEFHDELENCINEKKFIALNMK